MAKDPEGKLGAVTIKAKIFKDTGIDITRYRENGILIYSTAT